MSKSPWGNVGAWAEDAERAEAEEREAAAKSSLAVPPMGFPSLRESVTTAKQKKKTKMTLQEFTMQHSNYAGSGTSQGLTDEEMLRLPTGPKQRSAEELRSGRLGGGFSSYGSRIGSSTYNNNNNSGWPREDRGRRSYGYDEDERRGISSLSRAPDFNQPSRADEADNWGSMKQSSAAKHIRTHIRPADKYSSLGGDAGLGIASRADEVDNWASLKKPLSQTTQQDRPSNFWSVTTSSQPDRWIRNAHHAFGSGSAAPEPDNRRGVDQNLVLGASNDSALEKKVIKPNPFGAARPREEVLAEKGLDWKKIDLEIDEKKPRSVNSGSRPTSSQSSRPESSHSTRIENSVPTAGTSEAIVKLKSKVNPFGDAKPREVLLAEKGLDWRKVDLELEIRRFYRTETEEEKKLKEEIEHLKQELLGKSGEEKISLHDQILQREQDLKELANKVRYSQRTLDRPISGSSRSSYPERPPSAPGPHEGPRVGYSDRPPSRPGSYGGRDRPHSRSGSREDTSHVYPPRSLFTQEEARDGDYSQRPRSRGASNSWMRPSDERRSFQGAGKRGFAVNRDVDRSGSRW